MAQATTSVSFFCQKCKLPLKLDPSLMDLNVAAFDQILAPLKERKTGIKESEGFPKDVNENASQIDNNFGNGSHASQGDGVSRNTVVGKAIERAEPPILKPSAMKNSTDQQSQSMPDDNPSAAINSLGREESQQDLSAAERAKSTLSHRIKVSSRLFGILSSSTPFDHPLCFECSDGTERDLVDQLKEAEKEREYYRDYLENGDFVVLSEDEERALEKQIEQLQLEDIKLTKELKEIESERETISFSIGQLKQEESELDRLEELFWIENNEYQSQLNAFNEERDSLLNKYNHATEQLAKLRKTNIYNDVFRIWYDGPFGTINNFRLGRLPNQPVEWSEINAAWGQCMLLLNTLANKMGHKFQNYRLIPNGSFSKIEKINEGKVFDLFTTGDFGRIFKTSRYDAMVAYLDCFQQLITIAESKDKNLKLPYKIEGDKIGGYSIRTQFNDTEWTKALKCLLTNLKWFIAWISQQK